MAMKRRVYTEQFKRDAVELVTEQGYGISEAARNLGINAHMLGRWKRRMQNPSTQPGGGRARGSQEEASPEQAELKQLRKEIQRLRMEREILKKTVVFFANESN